MKLVKERDFLFYSPIHHRVNVLTVRIKQIVTLILIHLGRRGVQIYIRCQGFHVHAPELKHHPCKRLYSLCLINKHVPTLTPGRALDLQTVTQGLEGKNRKQRFW